MGGDGMVMHMTNIPYGELPCNVQVHHNRYFGNHFHRGHELVYVLQGTVETVAAGKAYMLEQGDFAMYHSNQVHMLRFKPGTSCWICVFAPGFIPDFDKTVQGKLGADIRFSCDGNVMAFIQEHVLVTDPKPYKLIAGLHLACEAYLEQVRLVERNNREYALMNRIADYVGVHFRESLRLEDLARSIGYDYHYVSRRFHYIFNMSFSEYVNSYRLTAAMESLRNTHEPVSIIAANSGFQSVRNFNGIFRRAMNMTPLEYREKQCR